nr:unnamed protein product [Digitaria exilis]
MAWILASHLGKHDAVTMSRDYALAVLYGCTRSAPACLGAQDSKWVVPSKIYPVEIRSAGQAPTVSIALCLSFAQTQTKGMPLEAMRSVWAGDVHWYWRRFTGIPPGMPARRFRVKNYYQKEK